MPTYHLPSYFHNHQEDPDIFTYDYTSEVNTERAQVALSGNLFSFLQEGTKTAFLPEGNVTATPTHFLVLKSGHCLMTEKISDQAHYSSQLFFLLHRHCELFAKSTRLNLLLILNWFPALNCLMIHFYKPL